MKIIFLDIDGVLNCDTDFMEAKYFEKSVNYGSGTVISPGKLCWITEIIKQTDAKIVISSMWRNQFSLKELYDIFVERGFPYPVTTICGKTSDRDFRMSDHGEQYHRTTLISKWLDRKNNVDSYVILDDINERNFEERHKDNIVITNSEDGLNKFQAERAIDILGRNEEYQKKHDEYMEALDMMINCMV